MPFGRFRVLSYYPSLSGIVGEPRKGGWAICPMERISPSIYNPFENAILAKFEAENFISFVLQTSKACNCANNRALYIFIVVPLFDSLVLTEKGRRASGPVEEISPSIYNPFENAILAKSEAENFITFLLQASKARNCAKNRELYIFIVASLFGSFVLTEKGWRASGPVEEISPSIDNPFENAILAKSEAKICVTFL